MRLSLRTTTFALALLAACSDSPDSPEAELGSGDDAATMYGAPAKLLDASPAMLDATLMPPGEQRDATADAAPDAGAPLESLDVLFVIDNSGSMATEQLKLAREIPRMVQVLVKGDRYAGREAPPGLTREQRLFRPVSSLHLGVVSTNVGGLANAPAASGVALQSCLGAGDDAALQSSTEVAQLGVTAAYSNEFEGYTTGDVVIPADPGCALGTPPKYQEFMVGEGDGHAFTCVARLGVRGCPFEQPLEASWKALAPSAKAGTDPLYDFVTQSGQGDRDNDGFLREDAALAVIVLTDEDDCSVTSAGTDLFDLSEAAKSKYGDINLRCPLHVDDATLVQPVERYVRGLRSLKPGHPERVLFTAITGVPVDAIRDGLDDGAILALPEMASVEDPNKRGYPKTVCERHDPMRPVDSAFPGTRLVKTAQAFGEQAVLESICADEYGSAFDRLVDKLVPLLSP